MESIDPEEARRKLRETYELMTEDELSVVAEDAYDLTDLARETLQTEITERGFKIQLKTAPQATARDGPDAEAPLDISDLDLAVVARVRDISEATQVKEILDAACIPWCLGGDNTTDLNNFKESFEDGVYISVLKSDRVRARNALGPLVLAEADQKDDAEEEREYAVLCPKCQSPEVTLQGDSEAPMLVVFEDVPYRWICDVCGHQWTDDGIAKMI
jgi:hypothetical protein